MIIACFVIGSGKMLLKLNKNANSAEDDNQSLQRIVDRQRDAKCTLTVWREISKKDLIAACTRYNLDTSGTKKVILFFFFFFLYINLSKTTKLQEYNYYIYKQGLLIQGNYKTYMKRSCMGCGLAHLPCSQHLDIEHNKDYTNH